MAARWRTCSPWLDVIEHFGRDGEVVQLDRAVDDLAEQLLAADLGDLVVEVVFGRLAVFIHAPHKAKVLRDVAVEDDAADGNAHDLAAMVPSGICLTVRTRMAGGYR